MSVCGLSSSTMDVLPVVEGDSDGDKVTVTIEDEEEEEEKDPSLRRNTFAAKKTVAQGMMDIALITANANQLRFVLEYNKGQPTFAAAVSLIVVSLLLQIAVGVFLVFKGRYDLKGKKKLEHAHMMNNCVVVGVLLITVVNVFVASFSGGSAPPPVEPLPAEPPFSKDAIGGRTNFTDPFPEISDPPPDPTISTPAYVHPDNV